MKRNELETSKHSHYNLLCQVNEKVLFKMKVNTELFLGFRQSGEALDPLLGVYHYTGLF